MPDHPDLTAADIDALVEAGLRRMAAMRRLADHQAATANQEADMQYEELTDADFDAEIARLEKAIEEHRRSLERTQEFRRQITNLRMWPHRHNGIPDGPDATKIREPKP